MQAWPAITDPGLLARWALDDEGLERHLREFVGHLPASRPYDDAVLERALGYPWSRPERSFALVDGERRPLDELATAEREQVVADGTGPGRSPLLAYGSNASPGALRLKLGSMERAEDRSLLVLGGELHDFDVGAVAQVAAIYGSLPATVFPSPGTAARCAVLWVTPAQLTQLAWSEITYRLGHLHGRFVADEPAAPDVGAPLGFVSRFGIFCPDGPHAGPAALAAVPAVRRTAPARTQEQLLDAAAGLALAPGAVAADLVRATFEDFPALYPRIVATVRPSSVVMDPAAWTPYPLP